MTTTKEPRPIIEERTTLPMSEDGMPTLWQHPQGNIGILWETLAGYRTLNDVAELHRGLEWTRPEGQKSSTEDVVSNEEKEGFAIGLPFINEFIEDYVALEALYLDVRPERARRNALQWNWEKPKVLVSAARISRTAWRVLAVADTEGLYASQRFIGVWPHDEDSNVTSVEVLSAVLNGLVANVFVHHRCGKRDNDVRVLKQIPVPSFTSTQIQEITSLVDAYKDLRWEYIDTPTEWTGTLAEQARRALLKIDAAVLDAYALPTELETALLRQFDGVKRRHLPFSFTGYDPDEWAEVKAELAEDREAQRIADQFFALLRKKNLSGLTDAEQKEYDHLQSVRTAGRVRYRALLESGK